MTSCLLLVVLQSLGCLDTVVIVKRTILFMVRCSEVSHPSIAMYKYNAASRVWILELLSTKGSVIAICHDNEYHNCSISSSLIYMCIPSQKVKGSSSLHSLQSKRNMRIVRGSAVE
jgi:IS30 family transposase